MLLCNLPGLGDGLTVGHHVIDQSQLESPRRT